MEHLLIFGVIVEANDWYTVIELEGKRVDAVVYKDYVAQSSLVEDSHVLYVKVRIASPDTTWSEISSLNEFALWIKIVNNWIGIFLLTRCKYYNLEVFICRFETFTGKRTDVDACENGLRLLRKLNRDDDIRVISIDIINTMNQGFIQVEDDRFCLRRMIGFWEVDKQMLYLFERGHSQVACTDVEQGLDRLIEVDFLNIRCLFTLVIFIVFIYRRVRKLFVILVACTTIRLVVLAVATSF